MSEESKNKVESGNDTIHSVSKSLSKTKHKCKSCGEEMIKTHYRYIFGEYVCKNKDCEKYCKW